VKTHFDDGLIVWKEEYDEKYTMLYTVYNDWMKRAGSREIVYLNEYEKRPCAYHVLGKYKE